MTNHSSPKSSFKIIAGKWRGRRFAATAGDHLRPTLARHRETLFNWLMHDIQGATCCDCFAGSGALGLEALSRGAKAVTFVDQSKQACHQINHTLQTFDCEQAEVIQAMLPQQIDRITTAFDVLFIDPPFRQNLVLPMIQALTKATLCRPGCLLYVECEKNLDLTDLESNWKCQKSKRASHHEYYLYKKLS